MKYVYHYLIAAILVLILIIAGTYYRESTKVEVAPTPTPTASPSVSALPTTTKTLTLYYVALEDSGKSGTKIGCGDSLVSVTTEPVATVNAVESTMRKLLADHQKDYGQSGLYNALYQSNLQYESSTQEGETLTVNLSGTITVGGVCDAPRVKGQLEKAALGASQAAKVIVRINGKDLDAVLSLKN